MVELYTTFNRPSSLTNVYNTKDLGMRLALTLTEAENQRKTGKGIFNGGQTYYITLYHWLPWGI